MASKPAEGFDEVDLWRVRGLAVFGIGTALYSVDGISSGVPSALQPVELYARHNPGILVLVTLLLFFSNRRLFGSVLRSAAKVEGQAANWLRASRLVLSAIPLLGAYVLSIKRWFAGKSPFWFLATRGQHQTPPPSLLEGKLVFTLAFNLLVFQGWTAYLTPFVGDSRLSLALRSLALTATQVDLVVCYRRSLILWQRSVFLLLLSILWFFPFPYWVLAWAGHFLLINTAPRPRHRMKLFFRGRLGLHERLDESPRTDWWRVSRWRLWRAPSWSSGSAADREDEERRLVPLCRVKVFMTVFEASGGIILLALASRRWPALAPFTIPILLLTVVTSLAIVVFVCLALACDFFARFLGRSLISEKAHLVVKYFALSQAGMLTGTYIGLYLIQWDLNRLGFFLTATGGIAAFTTLLLTLPIQPSRERVKRRDIQLVFWVAVFAFGAAAGVAIRTSERLAHLLKLQMILIVLLIPFVALGTGMALRRRLRPFLPSRPNLALRGAFAFCMITAFLPLGGLAVPLWILFRRRLMTAMASLPHRGVEPPGAAEKAINDVCKTLREHPRTPELSNYFFSNIAAHLGMAGDRQRLFDLLEETCFLQDQLTHFGGFGKSSDDIETYAVPAAIEVRDWNRFLHFMLLAVHLRGTAEDLVELIEPLAQAGQVSMALDAARRIASPLDRSGAKAMIASKLPMSSDIYQGLLHSVPHDLASLPPPPTDPILVGPMMEKELWMTVVVAQAFGLAAREALAPFLTERPAWWSDALWINMAQRHAEQYGLLDPDLWLALGNLQDPALLKGYLPEQLIVSADLSDPAILIALIEKLSNDPELSWLCRFTLLDLLARKSAEQAMSLWQQWNAELPVCWSLQVVERATPFLPRLGDHQIQGLIRRAGDPEVKVALLLAISSTEDCLQKIEETRRAVEDVPQGATRVHWQLRFLGAHSRSLSPKEMQDEITRLARSFHQLAYEVETPDLCRFLELIAAYLPKKLEQEVMRIVWAPSTTSEALLEIAETAESEVLLRHLLEKADHYLLPFRPGEAEGFQAWCAILQRIVPRLCVLTRDLSYLERAVELNLDQVDELRAATVKAFVDAESLDLASHVCGSIMSRRLRRLTRLRMLAAADPQILNPISLFEAYADSEIVQDEVFGLQALAASSGTPQLLLHTQVYRGKGRQDQCLTLLRMTEQALSSSDTLDRRNEMLDRLVQGAGLVTSDAQLAALTPEITAIVASHSGRLAVTEVREALERLVFLGSVPWTARRDICETLLSRLLSILSSGAKKGGLQAREALRMILGLLDRIKFGSNQEIEERGILPVLFAVMDRLPLQVLKPFVRELPSEDLFPLLYVSDDSTLGGILDHMVEKDDFNPLVVETVLYLFSFRLPDFVPEILKDLTSGPFRDTVAANLLRHGWLPPELAPQVLPLIENTAVRMSTELFLDLAGTSASGKEAWLDTLASLLVHQLVEPADPRNEPWIRRLWTIDPERSRPMLAWGVLRTLNQAGRWQGMAAICLWLHAHLAPNAGNDSARVLALCSQADKAIQKALSFSPITASTNAREEVS